MGTLDTAINGLNRIQFTKMRNAKQGTTEVTQIATNVAQAENWTKPNNETSPGNSPDRDV